MPFNFTSMLSGAKSLAGSKTGATLGAALLDVLGVWLGSRAYDKAAKTQADAMAEAMRRIAQAQGLSQSVQENMAQKAIDATMTMYYQQREDLMPWIKTGKEHLGRFSEMAKQGPGRFEASPGYQFRLKEGIKALERGAAARGKQLSGGEQKALMRFGQNVASDEYQNFLNNYYRRLGIESNLAGLGQTATLNVPSAQTGGRVSDIYTGLGRSLGGNMLDVAGNAARLQTGIGQTRASGYLGKGELLANLFSRIGRNWLTKAT